MRISISIILLIQIYFAQDQMILKDGTIIEGEFDLNSRNQTSLRFKNKVTNNWNWYHINQVNFIKSFNESLLYPYGFVVNIESRYYHLPNVKHLPEKTKQQFFDSLKELELSGYKPCLACFDNSPTITDYQLEKSLARSTVIAFQNTHEILYEHPKLQKIKNIVESVLERWPETIKGYDYRVEVYRDENPNAMAIGGGNLYLSSGLLDIIEYDNELEAVIAHEISHVERRHTLRQFYEYQKKKSTAVLAAIFVGVAVAAAGGEAGDIGAAMLITAVIADFASELALKGYSREMEQEADIIAQLYFSEINMNTKPMVSILDKLATYTTTREGFLIGASAFSDHPSLLQRIYQVENSSVYKYDEPLTFSAVPTKRKDLELGFVKLKINYVFRAPSSNKLDEDVFFLVGSIINEHPDLSFRIDDITLIFLGSLGQTSLEGVAGQTVHYNGRTDFTGIIRSPKYNSDTVMKVLKEKRILPYSIGLSAIVLQKGKDAKKVAGYQIIQCTMTIN